MINKYYLLIFIFFPIFAFTRPLNTLSIKGNVVLSSTNISGDFTYTLRNESESPQDEWIFYINPNVNILSISQNERQVEIDTQQGLNYRIVTVTLDQEVNPANRSPLSIKFTIDQQNTNPRFTISSNYVFLDIREYWFPTPFKDTDSDFEFTIQTTNTLTTLMGGKKTSDATIINQTYTTWKNELKGISPSASLIILEAPVVKYQDIYLYSSNVPFQETISQQFSPYWEFIKNQYPSFSLSEIHILPLSVPIPSNVNHKIEGEFIGNIFLLNPEILDTLSNTTPPFSTWDSPSERLTETLIHELYHSFFPGLARHNTDYPLFTESLVQYLTWDLILAINPDWGKRMKLRTRFYLENLAFANKYNDIWQFLWNTTLLFNAANYANLGHLQFTDTLVNKYRYVEYTPFDVYTTIAQHKQQEYISNLSNTMLSELSNTNEISTNIIDSSLTPYDTTFFSALQDDTIKQQLYNVNLQAKKTNFIIQVTNTNFFRRKKISQIPVDAIFVSISHDYPFTWMGQLSWVDAGVTNILDLEIPEKDVWETNLTSNIELIQTKSTFDILEFNLSDNYISQNNIGRALIYSLNYNKTNFHQITIHLSEIAKIKLATLQRKGLKLIWDSTKQVNDELWYINAFVVKDKKRSAFISIPIKKENQDLWIYNIIDTE